MRKLKRGVTGLIASVCCMAMMSMTAFANTDTISAGEYGVLKGELSGTRAEVVSVTSINENPDNAYLTTKLDAKNVQGTTGTKQSSRGMLRYTFRWTNLTSDCYSVFGTQGVQGGSSQPAKAVYTYTSLN